MPKRSTNFTGKKAPKASHLLSLMAWAGMTDEEIKKALEDEKRKQEQKR